MSVGLRRHVRVVIERKAALTITRCPYSEKWEMFLLSPQRRSAAVTTRSEDRTVERRGDGGVEDGGGRRDAQSTSGGRVLIGDQISRIADDKGCSIRDSGGDVANADKDGEWCVGKRVKSQPRARREKRQSRPKPDNGVLRRDLSLAIRQRHIVGHKYRATADWCRGTTALLAQAQMRTRVKLRLLTREMERRDPCLDLPNSNDLQPISGPPSHELTSQDRQPASKRHGDRETRQDTTD